MRADAFISRRLRLSSGISTICTTVSFAVMIVAMSISSGFRCEIRGALSLASGDVCLQGQQSSLTGGQAISTTSPYIPIIKELPFVEDVRPVISRTAIVSHEGKIHGIVIKGVTRDHPMLKGINTDFDGAEVAVVPRSMLPLMQIKEGDNFTAHFVEDDGKVKVRKFRICSTYNEVIDSRDLTIVYTDIAVLRRLMQWAEDDCGSLEFSIAKNYDIDLAAGEIGIIASSYSEFDDSLPGVYSSSLRSRYPQIFDWLELIDLNVAVILALMIAVAGFNMISGLLILLFENISTIGLLKALGMRQRNISSIFMRTASNITLRGMAIGGISAIVLCLAQKWTQLVKLDPQNYFVDHVPISLDWGSIILSAFVAYAVIMLLMLLPTQFIGKVDAAKTLKSN